MSVQNWIKANILSKTTDLTIAFGSAQANEKALKLVCQYTADERENIQIIDAPCQTITWRGMEPMANTTWTNLSIIYLGWNKLGNKGFKYLSRADLKKLNQLQLQSNQASSEGLLHLVKGQWKHLKNLSLYDNKLSIGSIFYITKSEWPSIELFFLSWNRLTLEDTKSLVLSNSSLKRAQLNSNLLKGDQMVLLGQWLCEKDQQFLVVF